MIWDDLWDDNRAYLSLYIIGCSGDDFRDDFRENLQETMAFRMKNEAFRPNFSLKQSNE